MDHAEARELLEVAAVEPGGLVRLMAGDTPQAAALAGHLAGCAECTAEMARLRRVAGIVRGVVRTTPPPELRERTLAFVRAVGRDRSAASAAATAVMAPHAPPPQGRPATAATSRRTSQFGRLALIAAVVAIAIAGTSLAVVQTINLADRNAALAAQADAVKDLATVTAWTLKVSAQPDVRRVNLTSAGGGDPNATLLFSPGTRDLVVVASGLTKPPAGEELRCWVEAGGARHGVGKMFFGGGVSYWVGPVDAVGGLNGPATFGVSLVDVSNGAVRGDPLLVGRL